MSVQAKNLPDSNVEEKKKKKVMLLSSIPNSLNKGLVFIGPRWVMRPFLNQTLSQKERNAGLHRHRSHAHLCI